MIAFPNPTAEALDEAAARSTRLYTEAQRYIAERQETLHRSRTLYGAILTNLIAKLGDSANVYLDNNGDIMVSVPVPTKADIPGIVKTVAEIGDLQICHTCVPGEYVTTWTYRMIPRYLPKEDHWDMPIVFLTVSPATCKRVKVGTKEVDVFETVCE